MNHHTQFIRMVGPAAMLLMVGCAPAYHSYSDCYVNCKYCPPPPLAYRHYDDCVCHSCAAEPYLTRSVSTNQQQADSLDQPHDGTQ